MPTNYLPWFQELHREFVENDREQKHELSVRQKQQELEDRVMQHLARTEREREQQVRKVRDRRMGWDREGSTG